MDDKTYIEMVSSVHSQMKVLKKDLNDMKEEYIQGHAEFEIGDKVKVVTTDGSLLKYAFVRSREVGIGSYGNTPTVEIKYSLIGCKKDGTPSKNNVHVYDWHGEKIVSMGDDDVS